MKKQDAIAFFGSAKKLAEAVGVSQGSVSKWRDTLPPLRQLQLEELSCGRLKADRKIVYGHYTAIQRSRKERTS